VVNLAELNYLKKRLLEYLSSKSPGVLDLFNIYCHLLYKTDCITLLLTEPSKLYHIVLTHYRGDVSSADYAFTLVFLGPLALLLGRSEIARELLDLVKTGRDREFLELLLAYIKSSAS
jgi:hypothetical protein